MAVAQKEAIDYRKGFAWSLLFNGIAKLLTPVVGILVARQLGPEIMGTYMVLVTIMAFADLFRDAGVARVYLNEDAPSVATEKAYTNLSAVTGIVLGLSMVAIAVPVGRYFGSSLLAGGIVFGAVAMAMNGVTTIPHARLLKLGRLKEAAFTETFASVLSSLFALAAVWAGWGFWALASQLLVRSIVFTFLVVRLSPCRMGRGEPGLVRKIFGFAGSLTAVNVLWVAFNVGDQAIISKVVDLAAGGLYGTGKMIVTTADVVAKPLTQTVTVAFANRANDESSIRRTLYKSLNTFLVAILPIYLGVAALAAPLVNVMLGPKFFGTEVLLPALCLYGAAAYLGSFAGNAMLAAGRPQVALFGWLGLYAAIGAGFLFWDSISSPSAFAWIFAIGLCGVNAWTLANAIRRYPPPPGAAANGVRILAALGVAFSALAWIRIAPFSDVTKLITGICVTAGIYVAALGTFLLRNPSRLCSKAGVAELWRLL